MNKKIKGERKENKRPALKSVSCAMGWRLTRPKQIFNNVKLCLFPCQSLIPSIILGAWHLFQASVKASRTWNQQPEYEAIATLVMLRSSPGSQYLAIRGCVGRPMKRACVFEHWINISWRQVPKDHILNSMTGKYKKSFNVLSAFSSRSFNQKAGYTINKMVHFGRHVRICPGSRVIRMMEANFNNRHEVSLHTLVQRWYRFWWGIHELYSWLNFASKKKDSDLTLSYEVTPEINGDPNVTTR